MTPTYPSARIRKGRGMRWLAYAVVTIGMIGPGSHRAASAQTFGDLWGGSGTFCARQTTGATWCWGLDPTRPNTNAGPTVNVRPVHMAKLDGASALTLGEFEICLIGPDQLV